MSEATLGFTYVVISLLAAWWLWKKAYETDSFGCVFTCFFAIIASTIFFVKWVDIMVVGGVPDGSIESIDIISLDRGKSIYGTFSLGYGQVNDYVAYYAYTEKNGGFVLKEIVSRKKTGSEIIIYENDDFPPSFNWEKKCYRREEVMGQDYYCTTSRYIYVPTGSIIREFNP